MTSPPIHLSPARSKNAAKGLWILWLLFVGRVGAQLVQKYQPVDWLPGFEAWHSGWLPYAGLLSIQLAIVVVMAVVAWRLARGRLSPSRTTGEVLLAVGAFYFAFMLFRFGAALSFAQGRSFWGQPLPAFFHLGLSGWLWVLGGWHLRHAVGDAGKPLDSPRQLAARWLLYPVTMAACLWLHFFLRQAGFGLQLSSYVPLAMVAGVVTLGERWLPYREAWQPPGEEMRNDVTFMILVQVLWPKVLAFFVAIKLAGWLQANGIVVKGWWPHGLPVPVQAVLMILAVDFFRYWLHRASHEWVPPLWQLHAVHHSPHRLYWVNVARFHPIEKAMQFLIDSLPFILLGVVPETLAIYFICYSANGFFQHCNVDVRLGWVNGVIAGPELHRWHHSWEARESNKNYGNNLIIWDVVFGSYFLPKDRAVGDLGLRNRAYPLDFMRQMRAPFIRGADQAGE